MPVTKRYTVPKFWGVKLKEKKYVVSARPGPHSARGCVPLGLVLRDLLGHAKTMNEARMILNSGVVRINGSVRKERGFPVGLMDVADIGGDFYRIVPAKSGLKLLKVSDPQVRLAKIKNKTHVKKKKLQLNLHDGTNILADGDFKTSDVAVIDIATGKITGTIKFEKGSFAVVTGGHNAGVKGTVESIDRKLRTIVMDTEGRKLVVPIKYVFVVGKGKPAVDIGE